MLLFQTHAAMDAALCAVGSEVTAAGYLRLYAADGVARLPPDCGGAKAHLAREVAAIEKQIVAEIRADPALDAAARKRKCRRAHRAAYLMQEEIRFDDATRVARFLLAMPPLLAEARRAAAASSLQ